VNKSFDIHISRKCREVVSSNYIYKSKIMWLCIAFKKMRLSAVGQRCVWRQNLIVPALMGSIRLSFKSSLHLVLDCYNPTKEGYALFAFILFRV